MNMELLLAKANENRVALLERVKRGELKDINPKTIQLLEQPITELMRPVVEGQEEEYFAPKPLKDKDQPTVRVHILGQGFKEVAACKEVLPERKCRI